MILSVQGFSGIAPRFAPYQISERQAQTAQNTRLWSGILEPLPGVTDKAVLASLGGTIRTIFLHGTTPTTVADWLAWTTDVKVCRSQIAGDTTNRIYYTGDGVPKLKDNTNTYDLKVPAPSDTSFVLTPQSYSPPDGAVVETRAYVYTYVRNYNGWQEESAPSGVVTVDAYPLQSVSIGSLASIPTNSSNITHRRFYRTSTGSQGTSYYYVGEHAAASTSFLDNVLSENLGETLPSLDWAAPPDDLQGLTAMPNGVFAAFKGKDVYFCEPFIPHAYPEKYIQSVEYDIVGLACFGTNLLVTTKGKPYIIYGTDPATATMQKLDLEQACVSARSICAFGNGVVYASPDGLVYVGADGSNILTAPYLDRTAWQSLLDTTTIHGYQNDGRYYGFHSAGGFIFDPSDQSGAFTLHDVAADAGYADLLTDTMYVVNTTTNSHLSARTVASFLSGSSLSYTWKSKKFQLPFEQNMAAAQVIAQGYNDLTFTFWVDGVQKYSAAVTSQSPFRLPSGFRGRFIEFQLSGTDKVNQVHIASSMSEFKNV